MSKKMLALVAVGASVATLCAVVLTSFLWEQSAWPSTRYDIQIAAKEHTNLRCELLSSFANSSRYLTTYDRTNDQFRGCFLSLTGKVNADGSFEVFNRPHNPFSVLEWRFRLNTPLVNPIIKAEELAGYCRFEKVRGSWTLPASQSTTEAAACRRLTEHSSFDRLKPE